MEESRLQQVRQRAGGVCEYCRLPETAQRIPFEVEHIIPEQHGGTSALSNLAYSCLHCNRHKGPNISVIDKATSRTRLVRLFHPRRHKWERHFRWEGALVVGRTPIGRVTVHVLAMNDPLRVALRQQLIAEGLFLPS